MPQYPNNNNSRCIAVAGLASWDRLRVWLVVGLLALLALAWPVQAQPEFGSADQPSRSLPQWLSAQLKPGVKQVTIPPGRYYVEPYKREHLALVGLRDVEIIADGVELVCTQTTRAITIYDCYNLTIRGLTIDYDPLPFTQGRITEISSDKRQHTIELFAGYPSATTIEARKYEVFDQDTEELATYTYHEFSVEKISARRFRVKKAAHHLAEYAGESVGDLVVIASVDAPDGSIPHAIYATKCVALAFDGVTLYSSPTFGFCEEDCMGSVYRGCVVDRRPAGTDLTPRGHRRMRSLNADAFHSKHAKVGPIYKSCIARYMGDDAIAINTDYHLVMASAGDTLRVVGKHGKVPSLEVGDKVQLVSFDGTRLEDATVQSIQSAGALSGSEKQFISQMNLIGDVKAKTLQAVQAYEVRLNREVALPMGSVIAAAGRLGSGFAIIDCTLGPNRSRGIIVKAGHGLISGNTLVGNWGESIKVAPEINWLEAGGSDGLVIENNTITDPRSVAIAVYAVAGNGEIAPAGLHHDITIRNNHITGAPAPAIYVTSTLGLSGKGNTIQLDASRTILPWTANAIGVRGVSEKTHIRNSQ